MLTDEQRDAAGAIIEFVAKGAPGHIALSGYAGTGKTTVIGHVGRELAKLFPGLRVAWCAPTGKAASVLKKKLGDFGALSSAARVGTVHGCIYNIDSKEELKFVKKPEDRVPYDLLVVDEASMVTGKMFADIVSFGLPVVFEGNSGQLPPVGDGIFQPLVDTELKLEHVHRQALENPIIAVATEARKGGKIAYGCRGRDFCKLPARSYEAAVRKQFLDKMLSPDCAILCGTNRTRIALNKNARASLGFASELPEAGEKLICLKNRRERAILNGEILTLSENSSWCLAESGAAGNCYGIVFTNGLRGRAFAGALNTPPGEPMRKKLEESYRAAGRCRQCLETDEPFLFDYGYAISVHKAQGSEWKNILLYDERCRGMSDEDYARWLYTGITRASGKLCILG